MTVFPGDTPGRASIALAVVSLLLFLAPFPAVSCFRVDFGHWVLGSAMFAVSSLVDVGAVATSGMSLWVSRERSVLVFLGLAVGLYFILLNATWVLIPPH